MTTALLLPDSPFLPKRVRAQILALKPEQARDYALTCARFALEQQDWAGVDPKPWLYLGPGPASQLYLEQINEIIEALDLVGFEVLEQLEKAKPAEPPELLASYQTAFRRARAANASLFAWEDDPHAAAASAHYETSHAVDVEFHLEPALVDRDVWTDPSRGPRRDGWAVVAGSG